MKAFFIVSVSDAQGAPSSSSPTAKPPLIPTPSPAAYSRKQKQEQVKFKTFTYSFMFYK